MSIGEVLTNARRRAGLSVAQVSHQTRIGETIIAGIEGDDYSACGGDFCARGHIRSIAAAVGADPEPLIGQYDSARLGPRALTDEVTEPLAAVRTSQHQRPEPVTPAGVHHGRPPAGPVTPTRRRQRRRSGCICDDMPAAEPLPQSQANPTGRLATSRHPPPPGHHAHATTLRDAPSACLKCAIRRSGAFRCP